MVEPSLFRPLPPLSPSLISILASVDVQQYGQASQARWEDWNSACSQVSTIQACVACGTMASTWISRLILQKPLSSSSTIRQCIVRVAATSCSWDVLAFSVHVVILFSLPEQVLIKTVGVVRGRGAGRGVGVGIGIKSLCSRFHSQVSVFTD